MLKWKWTIRVESVDNSLDRRARALGRQQMGGIAVEEPHHFARSLILSTLLHLLLLYWLSPALGEFFLSFTDVLPIREAVYVVEGEEFLTPEQLARSAMALAAARAEGGGMPEASREGPPSRSRTVPPVSSAEPEAVADQRRARELQVSEEVRSVFPAVAPPPAGAGAEVDRPPLPAPDASTPVSSLPVLTVEGRLTLPAAAPTPAGEALVLKGDLAPDASNRRGGPDPWLAGDMALALPLPAVVRGWISPSVVTSEALAALPQAAVGQDLPAQPDAVFPRDAGAAPAVAGSQPVTAARPQDLPVSQSLPPGSGQAVAGTTSETPLLSGPVTAPPPAAIQPGGVAAPDPTPPKMETAADPTLFIHDPLVVGGNTPVPQAPVEDALTASPGAGGARLELSSIADDKARLTPTLRTYVAPEYPAALKGSGIKGFVAVRLRVDLEGQVIHWEIANWQGDEAFVQAVSEVVAQWRFTVHPAWVLAGQEPPTFTVPIFFEEP